MTWFRLDDGFHTHPKVDALLDGDHHDAAIALFALAGCWCSQHLTDGYVTRGRVRRMPVTNPDAAADELVRVGLWEPFDDGFRFHDWDDWNPTRDDVETTRERERQRKAEWRAKKAEKRSRKTPDRDPPDGGGAPPKGHARDRDASVPRDMSTGQTPESQRDNSECPAGTSAMSRPESALPDPTRPDPTYYMDLRAHDPTGGPPEDPPLPAPDPGGGAEVIHLRRDRPPPTDLGEAQTRLTGIVSNAWLRLRAAPLSGEHQALRDVAVWGWELVEADGARFVEVMAALVQRWISDPWVVQNRTEIHRPVANLRTRLLPLLADHEAEHGPITGPADPTLVARVDARADLEAQLAANKAAQDDALVAGDFDRRDALIAEADELRRRWRESEGAAE